MRGGGVRRAGKALLLVGVVVLLVTVVAGVALVGIGRGLERDPEERGTHLTGNGELTLTAGATVVMYRDADAETPSCVVTGPDGPLNIFPNASTVRDGGWTAFAQVAPRQTGTYTVRCDPEQPVLVADMDPDHYDGLFVFLGGYLVGFVGGVSGLLLAIVGLVMLLAGRRHGRSTPV